MIHTQWWYQENGETKQALTPVSAMATLRLPRRTATKTAAQVTAKVPATHNSHTGPPSMPA